MSEFVGAEMERKKSNLNLNSSASLSTRKWSARGSWTELCLRAESPGEQPHLCSLTSSGREPSTAPSTRG